MQKQLSIHLDEGIYGKLCQVMGKGKMNHYGEELGTSYVTGKKAEEIERMREMQALLWSEAIF